MSLLFAACVPAEAPTLTPTRGFSAPTLAPSPTAQLRFSDEIAPANQAIGQNDPTAAALPNQAGLPPNLIEVDETRNVGIAQVVMDDGFVLSGELYESELDLSPGILLLRRADELWGEFPGQLRSAGYTVLVADYSRPTPRSEDISTMILALSESVYVDREQVAVIGAGMNADLGFVGCAVSVDCSAAVLLDPTAGETLRNMLPSFSPRPLFIAVNRNDHVSYATGQTLAQASTGNVQFLEYSNGQGAALLQLNADLSPIIISWLNGLFIINP